MIFISKPPDLNRLLTAVRNALENKSLRIENKSSEKKFLKKIRLLVKVNRL